MDRFNIDEERKKRMERRRKEKIYRRRRMIAGAAAVVLLLGSARGIGKFISKGQDQVKDQQVEINNEYVFLDTKDILSSAMGTTENDLSSRELLEYRQLKLRENTTGRGARQALLPKEVYLTFDDGPSQVTEEVLDILKEEGVHATFFVMGKNVLNYPEMTRRIIEEGHDIGIHTHTHVYSEIYKSEDTLREDINLCLEALREVLGDDFDTNIYRFPGGGFNRSKFKPLVEEMGLIYYDWNTLNGDAEGHNLSPEHLLRRYKETSKGQNQQIVLMHDAAAKQTTADSLSEMIRYIKKGDYKFKTLGDL